MIPVLPVISLPSSSTTRTVNVSAVPAVPSVPATRSIQSVPKLPTIVPLVPVIRPPMVAPLIPRGSPMTTPVLPTFNLSNKPMPTSTIPVLPTLSSQDVPSTYIPVLPTLSSQNVPSADIPVLPTLSSQNVPSTYIPVLPTLSPQNVPAVGIPVLPTLSPQNVPSTNIPVLPTLSSQNVPAVGIPVLPTLSPQNVSAVGIPVLPTMNLQSPSTPMLPIFNLPPAKRPGLSFGNISNIPVVSVVPPKIIPLVIQAPTVPLIQKKDKLAPPVLKIPDVSGPLREIKVEIYDVSVLLSKVTFTQGQTDIKLPKIIDPKIALKNGFPYYAFNVEDTYITESDGKRDYHSRLHESKNAFGWGQRKLGLALIQFLAKYLHEKRSGKKPEVVYAGAAPGINIEYVSNLFKDVTFHLYDPQTFKIKNLEKAFIYDGIEGNVLPKHQIIIYTGKEYGFFTDEIARKWAERQRINGNIFFISDIRSVNHETDSSEDFEIGVWKDMTAQSNWHKIIRPIRSQLKFRLPYDLGGKGVIRDLFPEKRIPYLSGIIYKGIYTKPTSTETRLVTDTIQTLGEVKDVSYDYKDYESKMFYFNTEIKEKRKYLNLLDNSFDEIYPPNLLNDYNSTAEVFVWIDLLKLLGLPISRENVIKLSDKLSVALSVGGVKTLSRKRKM